MKIIVKNKKARFNYEILESFEAGIVLKGSEVKSLRQGNATINESYAKFLSGELYLINSHIAEYKMSNVLNHDPRASRKLLMKKRELKKLIGKTQEKSLTLVPLKLYFNEKNKVKVELALAKGKKVYDKRETLKRKTIDRDTQREIKRY